jgi:hypothetical protein
MVSCRCGLIRPKSQIPNIRHDGTLSIGNFMLMMKKPKNLEFELVHPKNVLLASEVHGISCLFIFKQILSVIGLHGLKHEINRKFHVATEIVNNLLGS